MRIVFSKHADNKFEVLARHGWKIERSKVEEAVQDPVTLDYSRLPLIIVQTSLDETHVFRVVYREDGDVIFIITFYPGRITQYGNSQ